MADDPDWPDAVRPDLGEVVGTSDAQSIETLLPITALESHLDQYANAPLTLSGVSKSYGSVTALRPLTMRIEPGELHCLLGPNGSGKTTLGRIATGLTRPDNGDVERPPGGIGYGFQRPRLYPSLSVTENLTTFRTVIPEAVPQEWVDGLMRTLRLDRVSHQRAGALSGGFRKKLDLAIGLLPRPQVLWLDEPLADLDQVSVERLAALVDAYTTAGGAVVIATHRIDAFETATHTTLFLDGHTHGPTAVSPERSLRKAVRDGWDELRSTTGSR